MTTVEHWLNDEPWQTGDVRHHGLQTDAALGLIYARSSMDTQLEDPPERLVGAQAQLLCGDPGAHTLTTIGQRIQAGLDQNGSVGVKPLLCDHNVCYLRGDAERSRFGVYMVFDRVREGIETYGTPQPWTVRAVYLLSDVTGDNGTEALAKWEDEVKGPITNLEATRCAL